MDFVESAAVDSFVGGIQDWEVQLLVFVHYCENITAALSYALKSNQLEKVQKQVQQQLEKVQEHQVRPMQQQLEKLKERLVKMERRPQTGCYNTSLRRY